MGGIKRKQDTELAASRSDKKGRTSSEVASAKDPQQPPPSFIRGGSTVLTRLENREIQAEAERDVLFENAAPSKQHTRSASRVAFSPVSHTSLKPKPYASNKSKRQVVAASERASRGPVPNIEGLSYRRLVHGSKVLGRICQVNGTDIALSLPNNLTGYVQAYSISHLLKGKFAEHLKSPTAESKAGHGKGSTRSVELGLYVRLGQFLRASVTSTHGSSQPNVPGKKRIGLSLLPEDANQGFSWSNLAIGSVLQAEVATVEDHGLTMALGIEDSNAKTFLPFSEIASDDITMCTTVGAVILCVVIDLGSESKVVKVSADPKRFTTVEGDSLLPKSCSVATLLPGTAVQFHISAIARSGIAGELMGLVQVTADLFHDGSATSHRSSGRAHCQGEVVKGRVIFAPPPPDVAKLLVSLLQPIVDLSPTLHNVSHHLSSTISEATIERVEPDIGVFVNLGTSMFLGFAHISRLSDTRVESLSSTSGPYKVGSRHDVRILNFNHMDNLFILSLEPSILRKPFLSFSTISPGDVLEGKIDSVILDASGVQALSIDLGEGIRGYIPRLHFADSPLLRPETRFKQGRKVRARVLKVDKDRRRLHLTLKESLLDESVAILQSYTDIEVGAKALGTITNVVDAGATVQFFGDVRGFLPASHISESYAWDIRQHMRIGQALVVHVLSVEPMQERLVVSSLDSFESILSKKESLNRLELGSHVTVTVITNTKSSILLRLEDSGLSGELAVHHLADYDGGSVKSLSKDLCSGQTIADAVILRKDLTNQQVHLTCKQSLISAFEEGSIPASFSDVHAGALVTGFIRNITSTGIFVEFADGLTGLVPKSQIRGDALLLPDYGHTLFQTIQSSVLGVDPARQRFVLTLQPLFSPKPLKKGSIGGSNPTLRPGMQSLPSVDELGLGMLTMARIVSVKRTQMNVELPGGAPGRIDVSSIFDSFAAIKSTKNPLNAFKPKQFIQVRIAGVHDSKNHRFLPISHRHHATVFELSARPSDQNCRDVAMLTLDQVNPGSTWLCFVNNIEESCLWVNLSPNVRGRIKLLDVSDDPALLEDVSGNFPVGSALLAEVAAVDLQEARLDLSVRGSASRDLALDRLAPGLVLPARITKVLSRQLLVQLSESVSGPVQLTDLEDDFSQANTSSFRKNQIVCVCVTGVDKRRRRLSLSLRTSRTKNAALPVVDREIATLDQLREGEILRGFVKVINDSGVFVALGTNVTAFVRVSDLSDSYLKDWKAMHQLGQLVRGKVIHLDPTIRQVRMTLRKSLMDEQYRAPLTYSDYQCDQTATGSIRKVESFGIFVVLDDSANVSGLCHRSEMSEDGVQDSRSLFNEGERVDVKILTIDVIKRRMTLGLKTSSFDYQAHDDTPLGRMVNGSKDSLVTKTTGFPGPAPNPAVSESRETCDRRPERVDPRPDHVDSGILEVDDFDWTDAALGESVDSPNSRKQEESRAKWRTHNKHSNVDETVTEEPQSEADFERVLLTQPNSSLSWLAYTAFHLRSDDIEKARNVLVRAVQNINHQDAQYRQETANVWVAFLNLENTYGDESSLKSAFERACEYNDAQGMHEHMAKIFVRTGKISVRMCPWTSSSHCLLADFLQEADQVCQSTTKKFSASPEVWLRYANLLHNSMSLPSKARELLPRALQALPTHKHIETTSKFAQLEFRSSTGEAERGRTMFEGLLSAFPKRVDLWNVYLDQEIALGAADQVRGIFTRITAMRLKPRTAKYFFKRWLEFEEKFGGARGVDSVKARASEFVKSNNSTSGRSMT